jgi:excisionase family DNA binding protein
MDVTRSREPQDQLEERYGSEFGNPGKRSWPGAATPKGQAPSRLLTIKQVAELLQVPESWVYGRTRVRYHGRLPGVRIGKYWRFRESDIIAWLESQNS